MIENLRLVTCMLDNKKIKIKINLPIYIFVSFYLFSTIRTFLKGFGVGNVAIWIIMGIVLYIPLVAYAVTHYRTICYKSVLFFFIIYAYIILCKHIYPEYYIYYHETNGIDAAILTGCSSIFALIFIGLSYDEDSIYDAIQYTAVINLLLNLLKLVLVTRRSETFLKYGYDMDFGYKVLFSCMVFLSIFLRTKKKRALIMSAFCLILLLLFGSRGPLLCIAFYVLIYYVVFRFKDYSFKKKTLIVFCFILFLAIAFIYYYYIAPMIDLSGLPRSVRVILNVGYSDGTNEARVTIQKKVIEIIKASGFWGAGLLSDQAYLGAGFYSHNVFLELLVTFGRIPGVLVVLFLIIRSVVLFLDKNVSTKSKEIYLLFLALSIRLLVSYSFWYDLNFWCFVAVGNVVLSRSYKVYKMKENS